VSLVLVCRACVSFVLVCCACVSFVTNRTCVWYMSSFYVKSASNIVIIVRTKSFIFVHGVLLLLPIAAGLLGNLPPTVVEAGRRRRATRQARSLLSFCSGCP